MERIRIYSICTFSVGPNGKSPGPCENSRFRFLQPLSGSKRRWIGERKSKHPLSQVVWQTLFLNASDFQPWSRIPFQALFEATDSLSYSSAISGDLESYRNYRTVVRDLFWKLLADGIEGKTSPDFLNWAAGTNATIYENAASGNFSLSGSLERQMHSDLYRFFEQLDHP